MQETASNAGDPGLIPGLRRYPGEENSYPLQYSGLENFKPEKPKLLALPGLCSLTVVG